MPTRREFLIAGGVLGGLAGCGRRLSTADGPQLNDVQSQLNATRVSRVVRADSIDALRAAVRTAKADGRSVSIAGGRHAMGGQQFGTDAIHVDATSLNRVLRFDRDRGLVEVEAGVQWPELIDYLWRVQAGEPRPWAIVQKQTGADRLSIGGALSANVHGRGLTFKPIIQDVETFTLVDADGDVRVCSRRENGELFSLAIGGYGLFGLIASVTLRLTPRRKIERIVEVIDLAAAPAAFDTRIRAGFVYGDFQYATDASSTDFLRKGVFSCYRPIDDGASMPAQQRELSGDDWRRLLYLSHADKKRAFMEYATYYLTTTGQRYWSDTHQLSYYVGDYHRALDRQLGAGAPATEMITEIYVPRGALAGFMEDVDSGLGEHRASVIYGTIRLIGRDDESFLAWARQPWACVIFNLHVVHTPEGIARATDAFRRLIDPALRHGGSYYLTYHRWATRRQVEACYPQFAEFLRLKRRYDPAERFQSDWYRHYRTMFADALQTSPASPSSAPSANSQSGLVRVHSTSAIVPPVSAAAAQPV